MAALFSFASASPTPHDSDNVAVLKHRLGHHHAARTVVCVRLLDPGWLIMSSMPAGADSAARLELIPLATRDVAQ